MTKFFVQSGKIKKVIFAADANAAALWLMNTVMETFYPEQYQTGFDSDPFEVLEDGLMLLEEEVFVSRDGFDREDAESFDALDLFTEWNELVLAVAKMESMLVHHQSQVECVVS